MQSGNASPSESELLVAASEATWKNSLRRFDGGPYCQWSSWHSVVCGGNR